jgi:type I restriction enzyme M protein
MNEKILMQLVDIFRNEPLAYNGTVISLMLIAWQKVSQGLDCPNQLKIKNRQGILPEDLVGVMNELSNVLGDTAFISNETGISKMRPETLSTAISRCIEMGDSGLLDQFDPTDSILVTENRELGFPEEICDLVVGLAGGIEDKIVYLPWDLSGQLIGRVLKKQATGKVETKLHTNVPALVSSILGKKNRAQIVFNDPLRTPHFVEKSRLTRFNTTLALLPFNTTVAEDIVEQDLFDRFREKTRSMTVLFARHILAQTKGRAIITTTNNVLFSSGAERNLRLDLLKSQQLETVIAMPAGLLGMTAIPFSILILNTENPCDTVRLVNADTPQFKESISKTKTRLINVNDLVEMALNGVDSNNVRNVSTQEILENDGQLQVNRYVLGDKEKKFDSFLKTMAVRHLNEIATLIKPMAMSNSESGLEVFEVGAADIPDYGSIQTATKKILIDEKTIAKKRAQFLLPNDIVLIIKGNLGKVGIVPQDVPPPGEFGWIAGQSAAVIRVQNSNVIDPRALLILLRSEFGKGLVKTLESGSSIPFIQLRELEQLGIPIPTFSQSQKAIDALQNEESLQLEINLLQTRQASQSQHLWSVEDAISLEL